MRSAPVEQRQSTPKAHPTGGGGGFAAVPGDLSSPTSDGHPPKLFLDDDASRGGPRFRNVTGRSSLAELVLSAGGVPAFTPPMPLQFLAFWGVLD